MNKLKRNLLLLILTLSVGLGFWKFDLLDYLFMQASGQLEVLWNARPIEEVLQDSAISTELKEKILLVEEVKKFSYEELGLESAGLYHTIYNQNGRDILWNLSACEPFKLESVEWYFPIVGSVSYKGFFDLERAKKEEEILRLKGYDTRIRPVNAWSTLGWFSDPILSNNLSRKIGSISELFIHEITHGNIFVKDSLTFNENLASFIGEKGAQQFLAKNYGSGSQEYIQYVRGEHDSQLFINHCLKGLKSLDSLYNSFDTNISTELKIAAKEKCIRGWVEELDSLTFFNSNVYGGRFEDKLPNNAFFMGFERYDSKKKYFEMLLETQFNNDLEAFISFYKKLD